MTIEDYRQEYSTYRDWRNPIDVEVVREMGPCECGGKMLFQGWQSPSGQLRIAVAYCKKCRIGQEF